jgi:hypothetical protein
MDAERRETDADDRVTDLSRYLAARRRTEAASRRSHPSCPSGVGASAWREPSPTELRNDPRWGVSDS